MKRGRGAERSKTDERRHTDLRRIDALYRMLRLTLIIVCLLVAATESARAGAGNPGVTTSVVLGRTRFLSTEKAAATLTIVNETPRTIFFAPYAIVFLIRSGSQWLERPRLTTISHVLSPTQIAASSRFVMSLALPSCAVYSDPCSEDVVVKYAIDADGKAMPYQTALLHYEFVPDPNATYDIDGLKGNRPIFIAEGTATDSFFPNTVLLAFTESQSKGPPATSCDEKLADQLAAVVENAGLRVSSEGCDVYEGRARALLSVIHSSQQCDDLAGVLDSIRERFRRQVTSITQHFVLALGFQGQVLTGIAESDGRTRAQEIARIARAGHLAPMNYSAGPPEYSLSDPFAGRVVPTDPAEFPFNQIVLADPSPPPRISVKAVIQELYMGSDPAALNSDPAIRRIAATAFRPPDLWSFPRLKQQATIAADRPELYTFGAASAKAALGYGLTPYFVAMLAARDQTLEVSKLLGITPGDESLFALYPSDANSDTRAVGLATTFSGGNWDAWQATKTDPNVRVGRMGDPRQSAMLPISVPGEDTSLSEVAMARTTVAPDFLRLEVELDSTSQAAAAISVSSVIARLRRFPYVTDATATANHDYGFQSRYEIAMKAAGKPEVRSIVELLRIRYQSFDPMTSVALQPLEPNCSKLHEKLLRATIRENWLQALSDAHSSHRQLRKLLLFVVFPEDDQNLVCAPLQQEPGSVQYGYSGPESPLMDLTTMMVFRTFPVQSHNP